MRCRGQPVPPLPRDVVEALPWDLQRRAALDGGRDAGPRRRGHDDHRRRLSGAESPPECHPAAVFVDLRGLHRRDVLHLQLTLLMTDEQLSSCARFSELWSCCWMASCNDAVNFRLLLLV